MLIARDTEKKKKKKKKFPLTGCLHFQERDSKTEEGCG